MANVFRGVFDFEIRGADAIRELQDMFRGLGLRVDMVYDSVAEGNQNMARATARLHGLRQNEMDDYQRLIQLAHDYARVLNRPGQFSNVGPTMGRPGTVGRLNNLQQDAQGNWIDEAEARRRQREADARARQANQVNLMWQRLLDQQDRERHAAELRRMQEVARLRERFVRQRLAYVDQVQRVEMRATQQQLSDIRMRNREGIAESRRLLREHAQNLRTARRHLDELQRYMNDTFGNMRFPVLRVFAFDMLRRAFTNVYQLVGQIGDKIVQWTIDSVKFNDEIRRSETFFTSLGLIGTKGAQGGQITVAEARSTQDPQVAAIYKQSAAISRKMMANMMAISAETGQDLEEVVGSTRQATTDLLNKLVAKGIKNPFLDKPEVFEDVTNRMVRLATVLRMSDPGNRKLSFHMVGLQELFSGSTEGKKDSGLANIMSLMRREGIKVGKEYAKEITKNVNAGKLQEAMNIVEHVLTRSGLGLEQISNFLSETLQPSIDGTIMFLRMFGMTLTGPLYDTLRFFFQNLVKEFSAMHKGGPLMGILGRVGKTLSQVLVPHMVKILQIVDRINTNPEEFESRLNESIRTLGDGIKIAIGLFEAAGNFIIGFLSGPEKGGFEKVADDVKAMGEAARGAGEWLRGVVDMIIEWRWWLVGLFVAIKALMITVDLIFIFVTLRGVLVASAAAGSVFAAELLAVIPAILIAAGIIGLIAISVASLIYQFKNLDTTLEYVARGIQNITGIKMPGWMGGWTQEKQVAQDASDKAFIDAQMRRKLSPDKYKEWAKRSGWSSNNSAPVKPQEPTSPVKVVPPVAPKKQAANVFSIGHLNVTASDAKALQQELMKLSQQRGVSLGVDPKEFAAYGYLPNPV